MNREAFILELEGYLKARRVAKNGLKTFSNMQQADAGTPHEARDAANVAHYQGRIAAIDAQIDAHIAKALAPAVPVEEPEPTPTAPVAVVTGDDEPLREIRIERQPRGHYEFKTPRMNDGFLNEFKARIGKRFRFWNTFRESWQVTPLDDQMIDEVAKIVRRHFPGYVVTVNHATTVPIETRHQAFFDAVPKTNGVGMLGAQPR